MSAYAIEIYYAGPANADVEEKLAEHITALGGRFEFWEQSDVARSVCLTYEFSDREAAAQAAEICRALGHHVEGPYDYGP